MKRSIKLLLIILMLNEIAEAQNNSPVESVIEESFENTTEDITETEIPQELIELARNPLNLNSGNCDLLLQFHLITPEQQNDLINYRKNSGDLIEIEELQQIDSYDKKTIVAILPYVTVKSKFSLPPLEQITIRVQQSLQKSSESYPGSTQKILIRTKTTLSSALAFSFTGEKDQGEEFFSRKTAAFDFNSFNLTYSPDKFIRKIIAGDFNVQFGQGLTTWTGLSIGNGSNITGIYKAGRGILPYSGTDENRFQRGVAVALQKRNLRADIWISYLSIDANSEFDSLHQSNSVTSLQTTGYHRTASEIENYHSEKEFFPGICISYLNRNFSAGITASYQKYKIPILKSEEPYKTFRFSGDNNYSSGGFYSYTLKNIFFFGENAFSKSGGKAFINGLLISVDSKVSFGLLYRNYGRDYISLKSQAFGINTENANENGLYLGMSYKINSRLTYSASTDVFEFPFLKYRVDLPSNGRDFYNQLDYIPNKKFSAQFRFREKIREINSSFSDQKEIDLSENNSKSFRISSRFKITPEWDYGMRIEYVISKWQTINSKPSGAISQDLFYHPQKKSYSFNMRYSVFNCPDFDNRIYSYENDIPGSFSIPFYYGRGSRFYFNVNVKVFRSYSVSFRYSVTWLDQSIADEEEKTNSEIKLQIKATFR